jgi:radical SAM superfamily enzyme YgiQ (UPF0313 family)
MKQVAPEVVIILGGPEVSHETDKQEIIRLADYVITGWGDITFADLCRQILNGPKPLMKVHAGAAAADRTETALPAVFRYRHPPPHAVCGSLPRVSVQVRILFVFAG